jgi:hypothetical protein
LNYIHSYYQQLLPGSFRTGQDPQVQNGIYPDRIPRYHTVELFARYLINKNLTVSAPTVNAEDRKPPYDPGSAALSCMPSACTMCADASSVLDSPTKCSVPDAV